MGIQHDQMAHAATSRLLADIRGGYVEWRAAIDAGRLLVLSPFDPAVTRTTGAQAQARNEFIAALCHAVLIPHAAPGGKAEAISRQIVDGGQPLFTFEDDENTELLQLGAQPYRIDWILHGLLGD